MSACGLATTRLDKSAVIKSFNTVFFDFISDLISVLPENPDVFAAQKTFQTIKQANPTAIMKFWFKYVQTPYGDNIERGEVSLFWEKDYSHDVRNLKHPDRVLEVIDTIRAPIKDMGSTNHAHVGSYLQKLCVLTRLYSEVGGQF